jgi:hypothetical protein
MYGRQPNPGVPGSAPLPVAGSPGMQYAELTKGHPASVQNGPRTNPLNRGGIPLAGPKK